MLLKKKLVMFAIIFLLLFSTISYAQVCEVWKIKDVLRKILYLYFTEPGNVPLSVNEAKDMLIFYLSISSQNLTVDCSVLGTKSNRPIFDMVNVGDSLPEKIPSCSDETKYGECSKFRPSYCYAGVLYQKCDLCGCPANSVCGKSKKCETLAQNITCFKDIDCGQASFIGSYYCVNSYIYKNYVNYTCINPGTTSSNCVAANGTYVLSYCNPSLNQICVDGKSSCQSTVSNVTTANQTTFSGIVTIKGRIIDYFTKQPIANGLVYTWDSQTARRDTYTNSNGEFSTTADTTQITAASPKPFGIEPNCYDNMGFALFRNSDNSLYANVQINSLIGPAKSFTVSGSEVNLGDIAMWPAVGIQINSDIAVKFNLEYNGITGPGNSLYKTLHYLSYSFPLTVDVRAKLTDQSNNVYYSPYTNVPLSNGCTPVNLNFFNKQFAWNATTVQTNVSNQTTLAAPTVTRQGWGITNDNTKKSSLFFHAINFGYADPVPSAFRVYLKKPGESSFSRAAEFKNLSAPCEIITTSGYILSTGWSIYRRCSGNEWKIDSYLLPATSYPQGVYRLYLAAVDTSGRESASSEFEMYNLQPLTVLSPTSAQSPVSSTPTFQWTVSSGWPISAPYYSVSIYDDAKFGEPWIIHSKSVSAPISSTTASYVYDGPALDPAKKYIVRIYGLYRAFTTTICPSCDYISMDASTQMFWVSGNQTNITTCTDSDGGRNYYVKGTATGSINAYDSSTDLCSGNYVTESFCLNGSRYQESYLCSGGCSDGACVNQTTSKPDLIVSNITFSPANPTTADYTNVYFIIKNIGSATAWNFSTKVDYVGGQSFLFGTGALPPGATTQPGYLSNYWPSGTNTFTATVDINNNVAESDENNNVLTKSVAVTSNTTNQTTLKGYAETCTDGIECKYNLTCISDPLDNNIGKCGWWGSAGTSFPQCSAGYYPSTPCMCGKMAIYAGACNHGIFYWPPTQSGGSIGSSCTDSSQCSTGICIFGLCSYAVRCHPQTPGYCHDHEECVAFGASC